MKIMFVFVAVLLFWTMGLVFSGKPLTKFAVFFALFLLFVVWQWFYLLSKSDRTGVVGAIKRLIKPDWNAR